MFCTAVALVGQSAEVVPFQRHHTGFPPDQNATSADTAEQAARQFSGNYAKYANCALTTAIFITFEVI
jgi:hypothetical protein